MEKNKIFEKAVNGLAKQNFKQSMVGHHCRYRGPGWLKCAIGHLIPNKKYRIWMEGRTIQSLLHTKKDRQKLFGRLTKEQIGLLCALQAAHDADESSDPVEMKSQLRVIAHKFNLKLPKALLK